MLPECRNDDEKTERRRHTSHGIGIDESGLRREVRQAIRKGLREHVLSVVHFVQILVSEDYRYDKHLKERQ